MYLQRGYHLHNDKYQVLNVIGEGGFSLTYRGAWKTEIQGTLGKTTAFVPVCIKEYFFKDYCQRNPKSGFVEPTSESGKVFFEKHKEKIVKEARILAEISHPNVVNVLEVFKQNNTVYIVMEFISGNSLKKEVEENGIFKEDKTLKIIYETGQALDYIHGKNILHLDVKPSNILIDKSGNPRLIDFGISKKYDLASDKETSTTLQAASKGYASIEQYDSEAMQVFSPCPDVYSLGATMYFMLTGQVPTESILRSTKGLQNPREINPEISENTERVILKAMSIQAKDRYQCVMDMLFDLGFNPATDTIDESEIAEGGEGKKEILKRIQEQPYDVDIEDNTILSSDVNSKKGKKIVIAIAALLVAAGLFFLGRLIYEEMNRKPRLVTLPSPENTVYKEFPAVDDSLVENAPPETKSGAQSQKPVREQITELSPEDRQKEENYNRTYQKAVAAYNARNYREAVALFRSAEEIKKTSEGQNYISLCNNELDAIEVENRINSYEKMMKFGNFVVVKRKSDGKFGAIDSRGIEKIPCQYVSSEQYGKNRVFQKSDNTFDLYSPAGDLIQSDVSSVE
ncbi:MAG: serine/threonine protein kinase [Dysgonamonadaceae bacterium]|jgi:serine/threonine-protein kinase|nr:serine/threonine protein kinase [Dysgonamonadaceae bacterium]